MAGVEHPRVPVERPGVAGRLGGRRRRGDLSALLRVPASRAADGAETAAQTVARLLPQLLRELAHARRLPSTKAEAAAASIVRAAAPA